jgi:hypothetical protein
MSRCGLCVRNRRGACTQAPSPFCCFALFCARRWTERLRLAKQAQVLDDAKRMQPVDVPVANPPEEVPLSLIPMRSHTRVRTTISPTDSPTRASVHACPAESDVRCRMSGAAEMWMSRNEQQQTQQFN